MSLLNLYRQVVDRLRIVNGGTGNQYGWGTGVVTPAANRNTDDLQLGEVVYWFTSGTVKRVSTAADPNTAGVVVGHYVNGDQNNLVQEAVAPGQVAAIMTQGECRVLTSADVSLGDYAIVGTTDGQAEGTATMGAGCFGQYVQNGDTSVRPLVKVRLFGLAAAGSGGGGGTFGTPAFGFSNSATNGTIDEVVRRDATLAVFDATAPTTAAFGDAAGVGTAGKAPRRDHKHGMPSLGNVTAQTGYGGSSSNGSAVTPSRSDHQHGTVNGDSGFTVIFKAPAVSDELDVEMPCAGTFNRWTMMGDASGSAVIEVWKDTYTNYPPTIGDKISASDPPTISAATKGQGTCTGWTTSFAKGDVLRFHINSVSGLTRIGLAIGFTRT